METPRYERYPPRAPWEEQAYEQQPYEESYPPPSEPSYTPVTLNPQP